MFSKINKTFDKELATYYEGKNMSKHTNGPWNKVLAPTQIVAGDKIIANINHELLGTHEGYANAALIAAAPTMASRIQGALDCLSQNAVFPADIALAKALLIDALETAGIKPLTLKDER